MNAILALVDFSDVTPAVVKSAAELARATGANLCVLHATQPEAYVTATEVGPVVSRDALADSLHADHAKLQSLEKELQSQGIATTAILASGAVIEKTLEHAKKLDAAYIVLGSHRHGTLYHLLLGNTATGVLRHAPCPVLVVPAPAVK